MKIWISDLTHDQMVIASDSIPTGIGYVAAYLLDKSKYEHHVRLFKYPGKLIQAIEESDLPDIVCFSNWMWNENLTYEFVKVLKEKDPNIPVIYGGLNYPREEWRKKKWFEDHPLCDFYVLKEGEIAFQKLVDALTEANLDISAVKKKDLAGVHYMKENGELHNPLPCERVTDFTSFPSPYLMGLLEEFFDGRLMPILTTNRGCPFSCTFCTEGQSYYTRVNKIKLERVCQEVDYMAEKLQERGLNRDRVFVYISDSNFGMFKEDALIAEHFAKTRKKYGWPHYFIATTGKNAKERVLEVAKILDGNLSFTGSVQSLDKDVQKAMKRDNINADKLMEVAKYANELGTHSYSELILGLPGDSLKAHEYSLEKVVNAGFNQINTHQLQFLADCELADDATRKKYEMKSCFRISSRDFGNYRFKDGKTLSVVEIEEIVVEGINLSFSDYQKARVKDFMVYVFYNDRYYGGILDLLQQHNIQAYRWVRELEKNLNKFPGLLRLLSSFLDETKSELWDSDLELRNYASNEDIVKRCLAGELGAPLMGKYKILTILEHWNEAFELAKMSAISILESEGKLTEELQTLLDEVALFEKEKRRNIFDNELQDTFVQFSFDVLSDLKGHIPRKNESPRMARFFRTLETNEYIQRCNSTFGTSLMAKYKQYIRTRTTDRYRRYEYVN